MAVRAAGDSNVILQLAMSLDLEIEVLGEKVRRSQKFGRFILLLTVLFVLPIGLYHSWRSFQSGKEMAALHTSIEKVAAQADESESVSKVIVQVNSLSSASLFGMSMVVSGLTGIIGMLLFGLVAIASFFAPDHKTELLLKLAKLKAQEHSGE